MKKGLHCGASPFLLFVVADADIDAVGLQQGGEAADVRLSVVIGEQHLGLDDAGGTHQLVRRHRVGLVAGQESNVDVLDVLHLGNVLRVARNIDAQAVKRQDVAVVTPFGMILLAALRRVVGGHHLQARLLSGPVVIAVAHCIAAAVELNTAVVGDEIGLRMAQQANGLRVEVVAVLVGHQDGVGLGHRRVVDRAVAQLCHGVDVDLPSVVLNTDAGVDEGMEGHGPSAGGGEYVRLKGGGRLLGAGCQSQQKQQASKHLFHFQHNFCGKDTDNYSNSLQKAQEKCIFVT